MEEVTPTPTGVKRPRWLVVGLLLVLALSVAYLAFSSIGGLKNFLFKKQPGTGGLPVKIEVGKFASESEYKQYLVSGQSRQLISGQTKEAVALTTPTAGGAEMGTDRYSQTNVQVAGIDEADEVKTNGREIFVAGNQPRVYSRPSGDTKTGLIPPMPSVKTQIISAYPPLEKQAEIVPGGDLMLADNRLVILSDSNQIYGFDITNSSQPVEVWKLELDQKVQVVASRLFQNRLYLVTKTGVDGGGCIIPLTAQEKISCTDLYRPTIPVPVDSVYTVIKLNPVDGKIDQKVSFVGLEGQSVVYMSQKAFYVTYSCSANLLAFFYDFYKSKASHLISPEALAKLKNLTSLDISDYAKYTELSVILQNYKNSLSADDQLKIENETQNLLSSYLKDNLRQMETTGIIKIDNSDLKITASGTIPGVPLNQFSLDEYLGKLRIATTSGGGVLGQNQVSVSDVYVLDETLNQLGKVVDLGASEKIYAVRYLGDKAYVVTFRQTDPFYVLDLSNPKSPQRVGELRIPGYSSYLHPLKDNLILGVGKEGQQVKLSLFDVVNPADPVEVDKYNLNEYWTEILTTHRAFLQDSQKQLFFIPGSQGAYVFSYANGALKLVKTVADNQMKRAVFINDYLYLISETKITVLDENSWGTLKSLEL